MANTENVPVEYHHLLEKGYDFRIGDYVSRGFEIFRQDAWPMIGFTLLLVLINVVLAVIPIIGSLASIAINPALGVGLIIYANRVANNQERSFNTFFEGFNHLGQLIIAGLLVGIFTMLGMFLLILPGIYLAVAYSFVSPLIALGGLEFWPAMETSRKVITKNWFSVFLFLLVLGLIFLGGVLALGIGIFVAYPIAYCIIYAAFEDIFGQDVMGDVINEIGSEESEDPFDQTTPLS